jgi:hypothetical protein
MIYKGKEIFSRDEVPDEVIKKLNRFLWNMRDDVIEDCATCREQHNIHMHHENYDVPEFVYFLCVRCHQKLHRVERTKKEIELIKSYLRNNFTLRDLLKLKKGKIKNNGIYLYKRTVGTKFKVISDRTKEIYFIDVMCD